MLISFLSFCLGAGAVEFIICHAEIQIAFVEEKKIAEVVGGYLNTNSLFNTLSLVLSIAKRTRGINHSSFFFTFLC